MTVYVARSRITMKHYFIRVISKKRAVSLEYEKPTEIVNKLLTSKTQKSFSQAIDGLGPLYDAGKNNTAHEHAVTVEEAIRMLDRCFEPSDPELLSDELFLASIGGLRAYLSRKSPVADYDAYRCNLRAELEAMAGKDMTVIFEGVEDWVFIRSILFVAAALLGRYEMRDSVEDSKILESSGFVRYDTSGIPGGAYAFMFKLNVWLRDLDWIQPNGMREPKPGDIDRLYSLLFKDQEVTKYSNASRTTSVGGDADVFFLTRYIAQKKSILVPNRDNKYIFLCVRQAGSQLELARKIITALWTAFSTLHNENGGLIGIDQTAQLVFLDRDGTTAETPKSLAALLFKTLCYHKGKEIAVCEHCGSGVIVNARGRKRMFCSTACKVQEKNRDGYSYATEGNRQQDSIDEGEPLENTLDLTATPAGIERILEYARAESSGDDDVVEEFESLAAPMKPAALKAVNIRLDRYSGD